MCNFLEANRFLATYRSINKGREYPFALFISCGLLAPIGKSLYLFSFDSPTSLVLTVLYY